MTWEKRRLRGQRGHDRPIRRHAEQREFHRPGFDAVADTVKSGVRLRDYDFYFDYVVQLLEKLHAGRVE